MRSLSLVILLSLAIALPALAQTKEEAKKDPAAKVAIPTNTFFKGQTAGQYLAGAQLIGAKVADKDGQTIGTVDDLIVGSGDKIEGIVMTTGGVLGVGGKAIGVRLSALKISRADGKLAVSLPTATKDIVSAVPAYQRGVGTPAKK